MDTTTPATPPEQETSFFINRNFGFLWGGQAISNIGDFVFETTIILWIATIIARGQPWAPLAVSGVLAVTAIPTLIFGPLAGVFVDRWDKRQTMLRMDGTRALLIALLVLATGIVPLPFFPNGRIPTLWQLGAIYAILFLASLCAQFFNPARFALIGDVVAEPQRARAAALGQVTMNLAIIIGPPLAAPLLFTIGVQWALLINALSFVVSFLAILSVHLPATAQAAVSVVRSSFLREFRDGLRFFIKSRFLIAILVALIIVTLGGGALNVLDVFFVSQNLHTPASFYGILSMAFGAAAVLGAIITSIFAQRIGTVRVFWLGLILAGLLLMVFARITNFPSALIVYFLLGFPITATNTVVGPLILRAAPHAMIGRIISVITPCMSLCSILSAALAGYLASTLLHNFHATLLGIAFGPIDTIFLGMGALVILGGLYAMANLHDLPTETVLPAPATSA